MKKILIPAIALLMGVTFSAFSVIGNKNSDTQVYWYNPLGQQVGITNDISDNPTECTGPLDDCVKGYSLDEPPMSEPTSTPSVSFSIE